MVNRNESVGLLRLTLNRRGRGISGLIAAVLLLGPVLAGCDFLSGRKPAPDFTLVDLHDRPVVLSELRGKAVLLFFWATWAGPCRMSLPSMVRLKRDYGGKFFTVLGVTVGEKRAHVKRFAEGTPVNFTILVGDEAVEQAYFNGGDIKLPLIVLVDEKGRIVESFVGYQPVEDLVPVVERVVSRLKKDE